MWADGTLYGPEEVLYIPSVFSPRQQRIDEVARRVRPPAAGGAGPPFEMGRMLEMKPLVANSRPGELLLHSQQTSFGNDGLV